MTQKRKTTTTSSSDEPKKQPLSKKDLIVQIVKRKTKEN